MYGSYGVAAVHREAGRVQPEKRRSRTFYPHMIGHARPSPQIREMAVLIQSAVTVRVQTRRAGAVRPAAVARVTRGA